MILGGIMFVAGFVLAFLAFEVGASHPTPSQTNIQDWFFWGVGVMALGAVVFFINFIGVFL